MDKHEFIRYNFSHLSDGESGTGRRSGCCYCGKHPSRCSLGVRRDGSSLLFNCFAGNCDLGGGQSDIGNARGLVQRLEDVLHRGASLVAESAGPSDVPDGFVRHISDDGLRWLQSCGIGDDQLRQYDIGQTSGSDVVFPFGNYSRSTGYAVRRLEPTGPKWVFPKGLDKGAIYHADNFASGGVVLVEDIPSSIRLSRAVGAIALLGTQLSADKLQNVLAEVSRGAYSRIYVALDPDAVTRGFIMASQLASRGLVAQVVLADKDPKYWTDQELEEYLK